MFAVLIRLRGSCLGFINLTIYFSEAYTMVCGTNVLNYSDL